jgi:YVTN family beta-propeller protein
VRLVVWQARRAISWTGDAGVGHEADEGVPQPHTVYVGNGSDGTVSVINTATCNASITFGCESTVATVTVGSGPVDAAVNLATYTVYVVGLNSNTVSVTDGAACNATVTSGCRNVPNTSSAQLRCR